MFRDTSTAFGSSSIVQRLWNFGDGTTLTTSKGGLISHKYQNPGTYTVSLTITDASGCTVTTTSSKQVNVSGPKASFSMSGSNVPLNQTVYFYNNTQTGNYFNTQYVWSLGDGTSSTDAFAFQTYPKAGNYTIQLAAYNPETGCRDTAKQTLVVRPFNTAFQMNPRFLHSSNCPPVAVQFNNTSFGAVTVAWDFGDGTGSTVYSPTKIYALPGKYQIALKVFGYNGLVGTYRDSVVIGEPSAAFVAKPLFGCTSQGINFAANGTNVARYWWDFGDGTTRPTADSAALHQFMTPGIYQPKLLISDSNGCTKWALTPDKIVIDSLGIALPNFPKSICDSSWVALNPVVTAVGNAANYSYQWRIVYNNQPVDFLQKDINYHFNRPGKYLLSFNVKSTFGCDKTITDSLIVVQGISANIQGPKDVCINQKVNFNGSINPVVGGVGWRWLLPDNTTQTTQQIQGLSFVQPGIYPLQLIAQIATCADTVNLPITVHPNPTLSLANRQPIACLGSSVQLQANGADLYQWTPANLLNNATIANPMAAPLVNTLFRVTGSNVYGCTANDSVWVSVAAPINVAVSTNNSAICAGEKVNLQASGANNYIWIGNTTGLSNTSVANPAAQPTNTITYTVVGKDAVGCFSDTATTTIVVHTRPTVNAGPNVEITAGETVNFQAIASADVISYLWQPASFLSCTNCANPQSKPLTPIDYVVTVQNDKNCTASDTVSVKLLCGKAFYIPTSFTPNKDGKNDYLFVLGGGATVKSFRIFNRWGALVFERKNIFTNDRNSGWDGTFNGLPAPAGAYVYMAQIACATGEIFEYKGTVTLIR
jgi:gliding motility-associated-like protein